MECEEDILDSYLELLKTKDKFPYDVTFVVGSAKEKISCHKVFLVARSPVFETMFADRWASEEEIDLPDADPRIFKIFLEYLYAGKTSSRVKFEDISDIEMLMYLMEKYSMPKMMILFERMLGWRIEVGNVLQIYKIADRYNLLELRSNAERFATRSFSALISDPSFGSMEAELIKRCISKSRFKMREIDIFKGLVKWSEARCVKLALEASGRNKREMLAEILDVIKFPEMSFSEFVNVVVPSGILTDEEELSISENMMQNKMKCQESPFLSDFGKKENNSPFKLNIILDSKSDSDSV